MKRTQKSKHKMKTNKHEKQRNIKTMKTKHVYNTLKMKTIKQEKVKNDNWKTEMKTKTCKLITNVNFN